MTIAQGRCLNDPQTNLAELEEYLQDVQSEFPAEAAALMQKLLKGVRGLSIYIENNRAFVVNYGERYRNGEPISSAFVESTVNWVISKQMVKNSRCSGRRTERTCYCRHERGC